MLSTETTTHENQIRVPHEYRPIRAPRGTQLSCKGWHQEAALRMLMNNLDEEVGERPEELIVYGGTGEEAQNQRPCALADGSGRRVPK